MNKIRLFVGILLLLLLIPSAFAATLTGSIYNSKLELESNVLVQINTAPEQKLLSKDGTYAFELQPGKYLLNAKKEELGVSEEVEITAGSEADGAYVIDLFLLPDLSEEDDLWQDVPKENLVEDVLSNDKSSNLGWGMGILGIIILIAGGILFLRFRKISNAEKIIVTKNENINETKKEVREIHLSEQLKEELAPGPGSEPSYLDETVEIIKKHGGRIYQKELRKEMLHLSESKVSLILTELEHKGRIEKIKKGRGNAVILKR